MMSMSLINDLKANPHEYDFAQAMRLLMQMAKQSGHKLKLELKAAVSYTHLTLPTSV